MKMVSKETAACSGNSIRLTTCISRENMNVNSGSRGFASVFQNLNFTASNSHP
jgi:hypothetical protein